MSSEITILIEGRGARSEAIVIIKKQQEMKSKYLLCLLLSLSALSTLSAQTLSITGRLKSTRGEYLEISQVPVRLISLEDARTVRTQLTDSLGRFELEVVASRSYEL